jgi:IS30 family transposase
MYRRSLIGDRKWIEERILRDEIGHYELDFIVSRHSRAVLLVAVDTLSKKTLIELLPNRTKKEVSKALRVMFDGCTVKTILTDNDIAFKQWQEFEKLLHAPIYFCHPYHSWEKGLVENANKWIRHFIPKRTDLQFVTKEKIHECLVYLNDRPREVLQFRTANEVYWEKLT